VIDKEGIVRLAEVSQPGAGLLPNDKILQVLNAIPQKSPCA
jgi:hypothetical protein